jgi:hypothetical protein
MRQAPVENMSLGGARIIVADQLSVGDIVLMSITAPTLWDALVFRARVAWVAPGNPPHAAGVAFEHTSADAVFALYELISSVGYE